MRFHPVRAFTNPVTRPRAIVWSGVALILLVVLAVAGLDGTSTYFFCTRPCHMVHDDNTLAYHQGTHSNVSCVACHEPVNGSPIVLTLKKLEVAPDAITTIARTFELPMNHDNHIAAEMPEGQCTQCHNLSNRPVTASRGIVINHEVHSAKKIQCSICHNRVAHPEDDITLVLPGDAKHDDWMRMDACFRCHSLDPGATAPGRCSACHERGYKLTPPSHDAGAWFNSYGASTGHAKAAIAESATIAANIAYFKERPPSESSHGEVEGVEPGALKPSAQVNTCYTCHQRKFCDDCHQTPIPHSAVFKKNHAAEAKANPAACVRCHASSAKAATIPGAVCNACHHKQSTPGVSWIKQHQQSVKRDGTAPCFKCHVPTYCKACHVSWSMGD